MRTKTIGIVGSAADKFTPESEQRARDAIEEIITRWDKHTTLIVSGHSPLGGVDIWAEKTAWALGYDFYPYTPVVHQWNPPGQYGYKKRNLDIAKSDIVYVVVPDSYPLNYNGMKFDFCYHCHDDTHIKSGGCWTAKQAQKLGNLAEWIIIKQVI